ncbi:reverse transcriptase domain-containing protein [Tanacetum coccineum]
MHTCASNSELVEPLPEPEHTLNRRRRRRNRRFPFNQRNNPPENPRIVYPPILDINHFRHILVILENLYLIDDEPMWAADHVVALTPGSVITILETANEFAIKGNNFHSLPKPQHQSRNEHVNAIFTRSGKSYNPPVNSNDQQTNHENPINFDNSDEEDEEPTPQSKIQNPKPVKETTLPKPYKPKIPYPQRLRKEKMEAQYGKFLDVICAVRINVPLIDVLAGMPNYGKFLKELISNKHKIEQIFAAFLSDESSAMIQNKVPPKLRDPESFLIPCNFNKTFSCNALADLGASINLMQYSLYAKLSLENLKPTKMSKQLNLGVGTERMIFNIDSAMKHSYSNDDTCFSIDVIDEILEEDFNALLNEGGKILHSIKGTLLEEEIFAEFDEFLDRQKSYADLKRKPKEFEVGDRVMLKVLAKVRKVSYRLELPQELSRVHHTFHASNLKKFYANELLVMPLEGIHIDDKLQFMEEPVEIKEREIKRLKRSRIQLVKGISEVGYGIRDTWVDPAEAVPEIAPMTVGEVNTRVTELAELHEHDTQDLYALLEDAQDSRSRISQRVDMDSQRVDLLMGDRMTLQETVWMVEEEAYASREAWAHSIGLSQATHQELQTHRDHVYAHETYLQAHQTQLQLQGTLIQTQHQVHETRFQMQQAEIAALRETDRRRQAQMVETLRVMRDMRREMGDMQAELLALREQRRRARQPAPNTRIPDH